VSDAPPEFVEPMLEAILHLPARGWRRGHGAALPGRGVPAGLRRPAGRPRTGHRRPGLAGGATGPDHRLPARPRGARRLPAGGAAGRGCRR
jgi:hypothetical protein